MRSLLPWKQFCILLFFAILKEEIQGSSIMQCEGLQCFNNSPCRIVSDGLQSKGECACQQGWTGKTCQTQIHLKVVSVTMTTVGLNVEEDLASPTEESVNTSEMLIDLKSLNIPLQYSNYSIHYWQGNFSKMCNIVSMVMTSDITVTGLVNDTEYTFCLITEDTMLCNFDLVYQHGNVSYCTTARTSAMSLTTASGSVSPEVFYIVIVSAVGLVSLTILIGVLILSIRKKYFTHLIGARNVNRKHSHRRNNSLVDDSITQEMLLLTTPTTNQRIVINPPSSPGKPNNQLVNTKTRGYASFTAKDDQAIALSTVIEYDDDDCKSEDSFYDNQDNNHQQITFLSRDKPLL